MVSNGWRWKDLEGAAKGGRKIKGSEEVTERFCRRKMGAYSHARELLGGGQRDCANNSKLMQCEGKHKNEPFKDSNVNKSKQASVRN